MIFLPNPDGHIANVATFHDGFTIDFEPYVSRTFIPMPSEDRVNNILQNLINSSVLDDYSDMTHFIIHQSNASWIGSDLERYRYEIFNEEERYDSIGDSYPLETYKCESCIFIGYLTTGDYIVINIDPWIRSREIRHFEAVLIMDGIPINDQRIQEIEEVTELSFSTAESWEYPKKTLHGKAVSDIQVSVINKFRNEYDEVEKVICENPLYGEEEFLTRFFPDAQNILSDYKYVVANTDPVKTESEVASVEMISISDYNKIGRHITQNLFMKVAFLD